MTLYARLCGACLVALIAGGTFSTTISGATIGSGPQQRVVTPRAGSTLAPVDDFVKLACGRLVRVTVLLRMPTSMGAKARRYRGELAPSLDPRASSALARSRASVTRDL